MKALLPVLVAFLAFFVFSCSAEERFLNYFWTFDTSSDNSEDLELVGDFMMDESEEFIYTCTEKTLFKLDYTGKLIWKLQDWPEFDVTLYCPPVAYNGDLYINSRSFIYKLDREKGVVTDSRLASGVVLSSPVVVFDYGNITYVGASGTSGGSYVLFEITFDDQYSEYVRTGIAGAINNYGEKAVKPVRVEAKGIINPTDHPYTAFGLITPTKGVFIDQTDLYEAKYYVSGKTCESCKLTSVISIESAPENCYDYSQNYSGIFCYGMRPYVMHLENDLAYIYITSMVGSTLTKMPSDLIDISQYQLHVPPPKILDLGQFNIGYKYPPRFFRRFGDFYYKNSLIFIVVNYEVENIADGSVVAYLYSLSLDSLDINRKIMNTYSRKINAYGELECGYFSMGLNPENDTLLVFHINFEGKNETMYYWEYDIPSDNATEWNLRNTSARVYGNIVSGDGEVNNPCAEDITTILYTQIAMRSAANNTWYTLLMLPLNNSQVWVNVQYYFDGYIHNIFNVSMPETGIFGWQSSNEVLEDTMIMYLYDQTLILHKGLQQQYTITLGYGGGSYWSLSVKGKSGADEALHIIVGGEYSYSMVVADLIYNASSGYVVKAYEQVIPMADGPWLAPIGDNFVVDGSLGSMGKGFLILCHVFNFSFHLVSYDYGTGEVQKRFLGYEDTCAATAGYGLTVWNQRVLVGMGNEMYDVYDGADIEASQYPLFHVPSIPPRLSDVYPVDEYLVLESQYLVIPSPYLSYIQFNGYTFPFKTYGRLEKMITPCYYDSVDAKVCRRHPLGQYGTSSLITFLNRNGNVRMACTNVTLVSEGFPAFSSPKFSDAYNFSGIDYFTIYKNGEYTEPGSYVLYGALVAGEYMKLAVMEFNGDCDVEAKAYTQDVPNDPSKIGRMKSVRLREENGTDLLLVQYTSSLEVFKVTNSCLNGTLSSYNDSKNLCFSNCSRGLYLSPGGYCASCTEGEYSSGSACVPCATEWCPPGSGSEALDPAKPLFKTKTEDFRASTRTDDVDVNDQNMHYIISIFAYVGSVLVAISTIVFILSSALGFALFLRVKYGGSFAEYLLSYSDGFMATLDMFFTDAHLAFLRGYVKYSNRTSLGGLFSVMYAVFSFGFIIASAAGYIYTSFVVSETLGPMTIQGVETAYFDIHLQFNGFYGECSDGMLKELEYNGFYNSTAPFRTSRLRAAPQAGRCDIFLVFQSGVTLDSNASLLLTFPEGQFTSEIIYGIGYRRYEVGSRMFNGQIRGGIGAPSGAVIRGKEPTVFSFAILPNQIISETFISGSSERNGFSLSFSDSTLGSTQEVSQYSNSGFSPQQDRKNGFQVRLNLLQGSVGTKCFINRSESVFFVITHVIATLSGVVGLFAVALALTERVCVFFSFDVSPALAEEPMEVERALSDRSAPSYFFSFRNWIKNVKTGGFRESFTKDLIEMEEK